MTLGLLGAWWRPFARLDDVAVVHVDLVPDEANERTAWTWLDTGERHRAHRFQHTGARRRYTLCRASLRSLLCSALDCGNQHLAFEASEHGKPFAIVRGVPAPISFNVSHSGRHGLIALADRGRVGVDVEERVPRRNLEVLCEAVLGPREQTEVAAASGRRKLYLFFDLWTMKEALSKARGSGLSMDVSVFEIPHDIRDDNQGGLFRFPDLPDAAWRLERLGNDQFAAAVAHEVERQNN